MSKYNLKLFLMNLVGNEWYCNKEQLNKDLDDKNYANLAKLTSNKFDEFKENLVGLYDNDEFLKECLNIFENVITHSYDSRINKYQNEVEKLTTKIENALFEINKININDYLVEN